MKRYWIFGGLLLLLAGLARAQEEGLTLTGDGWVLVEGTSYDNPPSGWGSEDSDFALKYRLRVGAEGSYDRWGYKFRFTNVSGSDLYGATFGGGTPGVNVEHAYLLYGLSNNATLYLGRVPVWFLENDLVWDTGRKRGNDTAEDGAFLSFTLSELTNLYLAWVRLVDSGPGSNDNDALYVQLRQKFSDAFWGYIGATNITCNAPSPSCNSAGEAYTAGFAKIGYSFTPEFDFWFAFLASNGQINGAPEVAQSDTAAFQVGANYKASDLVTVSAEFASIGGSSVPAGTSFVENDYVAKNLAFGPSLSADTDLTYFNFRINYAWGENSTIVLDYTNASEDDATPSNTGNGFQLIYSLAFK
ncbi:MAG: hypothetical protein ACK4G3_02460 [bacterium]